MGMSDNNKMKGPDIINGLRSGMVTIVNCPEYEGHFALQINHSAPRIFAAGFETKLNAIRTYWRLKLPNKGKNNA